MGPEIRIHLALIVPRQFIQEGLAPAELLISIIDASSFEQHHGLAQSQQDLLLCRSGAFVFQALQFRQRLIRTVVGQLIVRKLK